MLGGLSGDILSNSLLKYNQVSYANAKKVFDVMASNNFDYEVSGYLELEKEDSSTKIESDLELETYNMQSINEAFEESGFTVIKDSATYVSLEMGEDRLVDVDAYVESSGDAISYYKELLLEVLTDIDGSEELSSLIKLFTFKEGQLSIDMVDSELNAKAKILTTSINELLEEVLTLSSVEIPKNPVSASFNWISEPQASESFATLKLFYESIEDTNIPSVKASSVAVASFANDQKLDVYVEPNEALLMSKAKAVVALGADEPVDYTLLILLLLASIGLLGFVLILRNK